LTLTGAGVAMFKAEAGVVVTVTLRAVTRKILLMADE
jgi:hypothetical protein